MAYINFDPQDYFNTVLYTGTGSAQSISSVGFQPDWVWVKDRNAANSHNVSDAVRGATKTIFTDALAAEVTDATRLTSFDSDGFSVGTSTSWNTNTNNYVSWNWKANGAGISNTDGSITSTVSANTTSGFSIVSWVATGVAGTIGHGLGVAPKMIIGKSRTSANHWQIGHSSIGWTNQFRFTTGASFSSNQWNNTAPTSSVFSVELYDINNPIGDNNIAYCFAEVKGFSKFGSYVGNGNADGTFIYTGFKPAFVIIKNSSSIGAWYMQDNKRDVYNPIALSLNASDANADNNQGNIMDFLSNGIKIRNTGTGYNTSSGTYIYMAFAENPLVNSLGNPATAR